MRGRLLPKRFSGFYLLAEVDLQTGYSYDIHLSCPLKIISVIVKEGSAEGEKRGMKLSPFKIWISSKHYIFSGIP